MAVKLSIREYHNSGPLNKVIVSLNNNVSLASTLKGIEETGNSPHIVVDEHGKPHTIIDDPDVNACVPRRLLSPASILSPAVWVSFVGTCLADLKNFDVDEVLREICRSYKVEYVFPKPPVVNGFNNASFIKASGVIQCKDVFGYESSTLLPVKKNSSSSLFVAEFNEVDSLEASAQHFDDDAAELSGWPEFKGRPIKPGSKSEKIAVIAEAHGIDSVEYDEDIEAIVITAQQEAGLEPDGVIDAATWVALNPDK